MKLCKICKLTFPDIVMVDNKTCYCCEIKNWPIKTKKQYRRYLKAVAIRVRLNTPIDNLDDAIYIVDSIGLNRLHIVEKLIQGKFVAFNPQITFTQRVKTLLQENSNGE